MKKTIIFGGTSEGRKLAKLCYSRGMQMTVCVATQYGEELLQELPAEAVHTGRMDQEEIKAYLEQEAPDIVVDATHPYAVLVSEHVKKACRETEIEYCRLRREPVNVQDVSAEERIMYADSAAGAAEKVKNIPGNIFLTTGSKELQDFCGGLEDLSRLYVRILPSEEALRKCSALGLSGRQIICMQGPFSEEINKAMFVQTGAEILVTKESGSAGGFPEKLKAAEQLSMITVVIRRPGKEEGCSFEEVCGKLGLALESCRKIKNAGQSAGVRSGLFKEGTSGKIGLAPELTLAGIGMGSMESMTGEARKALEEAEVLFGAQRILESAAFPEKKKVCEYKSAGIKEYLAEHPGIRRAAVLFSGDVGFYSGAKKLCEEFAEYPLRLVSGVSTVSYLAGKLRMPWQDIKLCSLHGRNCNLAAQIRREKKVFALFGKGEEIRKLAEDLTEFGMGQVRFFIGVNLSYEDERIIEGFPADFLDFQEAGLCAGIFENKVPETVVTPGIEDEVFLRGKVPMTKREIRELAVCRLELKKDSVVYDIGAGTGSVSIECAGLLPEGKIYAIERNEEALELLAENRKKFGAQQMEIIAGEAPEALKELPAPTHVFIGGSGGKLKEIMREICRKGRGIRIVMTAVSLETQTELTALLREFPVEDLEAVSVSASRLRTLGEHHLWQGMNPVVIFSFWLGDTKR